MVSSRVKPKYKGNSWTEDKAKPRNSEQDRDNRRLPIITLDDETTPRTG